MSPEPDPWYVYVDETGNLDMESQRDSTPVFGIATASFTGDHGQQLWEGMKLRLELEAAGVQLPTGLHATNDRPATRHKVIDLMLTHRPRLDATLLWKQSAYEHVRKAIEATGGVHLYQQAFYAHFKYLARYVIPSTAQVYVIAGTLGSARATREARAALTQVCEQFRGGRQLVLCTWSTPTSWGIQMADYAAWSAFRREVNGACEYYSRLDPLFKTRYVPWRRK